MKPSKESIVSHILGAVVIAIAAAVSVISSDNTPMAVGLGGGCLLWIMGIERDIYHKEEPQ